MVRLRLLKSDPLVQARILARYHRKKSFLDDNFKKDNKFRFVKHTQYFHTCKVGPENSAHSVGCPALIERSAQDLIRHGVEVPVSPSLLSWGEFRRGDVFMSPHNDNVFLLVRGKRKIYRGMRDDKFLHVAVHVRQILKSGVGKQDMVHGEEQTVKYVKIPSIAYAQKLMLLNDL